MNVLNVKSRGKKRLSPSVRLCSQPSQASVSLMPGQMRQPQQITIALGRPDFPTAPATIRSVKANAAATTNPTLNTTLKKGYMVMGVVQPGNPSGEQFSAACQSLQKQLPEPKSSARLGSAIDPFRGPDSFSKNRLQAGRLRRSSRKQVHLSASLGVNAMTPVTERG